MSHRRRALHSHRRGTGRALQQQDHLEAWEWSGFPDRVGLAWEWVLLPAASPHPQAMFTQEPRTFESNKLSSTENLRCTLFGSFTKLSSEFSSTLGVVRQESRLYLCLFSCVYTCVCPCVCTCLHTHTSALPQEPKPFFIFLS